MYEELKKLAEDYNPGTFDSIDPEEILALLAERNQLKAENEALRKDAERYSCVRNRPLNGNLTASIVYENLDTGSKVYVDGIHADTIVDGFMSKDVDQ